MGNRDILTVREHMLIQHFAARSAGDWFKREGALRHLFGAAGATPTQVHAELLALLDRPAAEATYPLEVHRLRRLRAARRIARSALARPVSAATTTVPRHG